MAALVSGLSAAAYLATMGSEPFWQDAGLFLAAMDRGGGLVPPGYPLWLMLGRPFVALVRAMAPGATLARAVHLFDAVQAALAAGLVTLAAATLMDPRGRFFVEPAPRTALSRLELGLCAIGGLLAGWGYSLWSQAINAEAYALNALFAAALLVLVLELGRQGPLVLPLASRPRRLLLLMAAVQGLALANHPDIVVFGVAWLWLVVTQPALRAPRVLLLVMTIGLLCALVPYLYLPWIAWTRPDTMFRDVLDVRGLLRHLAGAQWTAAEESYGWSMSRLADFPLLLWHELFAVGLFGLAAGLWHLRRAERALAGVLGALLLASFLLPHVYQQGGEYDLWLIPFYLVAAAIVPTGLRALLDLPVLRRHPALALAALVPAAIVPPLMVNLPLLDRRAYHVPEDFARNLYRRLPARAVLLAWSDQECSLGYAQRTLSPSRADVVFVPTPMLTPAFAWLPAWLRQEDPTLVVPDRLAPLPEDSALALIAANPGRAFFTSKRPAGPLPAGRTWVPAGALWKTEPGPPRLDLDDWAYVYRNTDPFDGPARKHAPLRRTDPATGRTTVVRTRYTDQIRLFHAQAWKNLGDWQADHGAWDRAVDAYRKVFAVDPGVENAALFAALGKALFAVGQDAEASRWLRQSVELAPGNAEARLYLGQIAARQGRPESAALEYEQVRRMAPAFWKQQEPALRQAGLLPAGF